MTENKIKYNSYENSFYINDDEGISQIIAPELIIEIITDYEKKIVKLIQESKELKHYIKKLEKELHLVHMSAMFSTVKSFNGDVSKRYCYSEETDTIYDTANNYGQYHKILDKKEIAMLLNEYETMLNGDDVE